MGKISPKDVFGLYASGIATDELGWTSSSDLVNWGGGGVPRYLTVGRKTDSFQPQLSLAFTPYGNLAIRGDGVHS